MNEKKKKKLEEKDVQTEEKDVQTTFNEDDINVLVEEGEVHNEDQNGKAEE